VLSQVWGGEKGGEERWTEGYRFEWGKKIWLGILWDRRVGLLSRGTKNSSCLPYPDDKKKA